MEESKEGYKAWHEAVDRPSVPWDSNMMKVGKQELRETREHVILQIRRT